MKKLLPGIIILFLALNVSAKKVKFAVDMTGQTISPLGMHIVGDFQVAAGYALDWDPSLTTLTQEGSTDIYSIIVTIPAFQKYEYRFVNGDQTYESEFVPDESRVGYNLNDNRWLYVDSLKNDTTFVGAIVFGGNAPAGLNLIRYKVDVSALTPATYGVHVITDYNNFLPYKDRLYSFGNNVFEIIHYLPNGSYTFKYLNGKTLSDIEGNVPAPCGTSGYRTITLAKDSLLPEVCFSYCVACALVSVNELAANTSVFKAYPNPASNAVTVSSSAGQSIDAVQLYSVSGQLVYEETNIQASTYTIQNLSLPKGLYLLQVSNADNKQQHIKITIE